MNAQRFLGASLLPLLLFTLPAGAASQTSEHRMQQMYVAYYGRPGDPGGVAWWADQLEASGGALEKIIDAFATSDEFTKRFGTLSNEQLVANLYQQMFGRTPEQDGLEWWLGELNSHRVTLGSAAIQIADGAQGNDKTTLDNRTLASEKFTAELAASQKQFSLNNVDAARNMILQVGATTNMEELGVKKSVSLMASSNINMLSAAITPENQQELAVAAARGIKKAIVTETRTGEKTVRNPASTASGIIVEDNFCSSGHVDAWHEDDFSYSSYTYHECWSEEDNAILLGREEWWVSEDFLSQEVRYTDFFSYDLFDGSWYWIEGTIYSEWSEDYQSSFSEFTDFAYQDSWGELYMVSYAQEWCTYESVEVDDDGLIADSVEDECEWFEPEFEDPYTGETYMIEEEEVAVAGEDEFTASAKVYDGAEGWVNAKTLSPVSTACANGTLSGGSITFTTKDNKQAQMNLLSCDQFEVTFEGNSSVYNWSDFQKGGS